MSANIAETRGLRFACKEGCGFCCTASPFVLPHEAGPLGPLVERAQDGTLRIPIRGVACSSLQADRRCGVYDPRPSVCHLYPYAVHAGRRIQVTVSLACPGIEGGQPIAQGMGPAASPTRVGEAMEEGATRAADLALAQPGAKRNAEQARATFAEFDRRMKEWGVAAPIEKVRTAFMPHLAALAQPPLLPSFFAAIEPGELVLGNDPVRDIGALFEIETEIELVDLFRAAAHDALDEPDTVIWVEPDLTWVRAEAHDDQVRLTRKGDEEIALDNVPGEWTSDASAVLAIYLARLLHRDHTEGSAAWLVDASQYQVTPAAAYARVLSEAALQVALRAGLLAAAEGHDVVDAAYARRGVMAYETAFHSLPTLGSIL